MYKKHYKLNFPQRKKLLSYLNALLKEKSHDSYFIDLTVRRKMPEYKILKLASMQIFFLVYHYKSVLIKVSSLLSAKLTGCVYLLCF